ncbi:DUF881 domain-containing protein [Nocardioides houyundeii]|uniref:DUF881 domain-containing protein n=1 Tax=Nocardioides houyundeii TaxID=2045452 RepID=UPI000C764846|nr:DUF881 domain-containing protein [Nocardioides houyundeii]
MSAEERRSSDLPQHVTQPLLSLITSQSMDEDYQHVAARRAVGEGQVPTRGRGRRVATGAAIAVFGILVAVAAVQTSLNADVDALGRASLISRIQDEKEDVTVLRARAGEVRDDNVESDDELRQLRQTEQELGQRVSRLGVRTGYLAVRGPGVRITVDDAPEGDEDPLVRASDLGILVDGLWAAGAEAVAINGQRLTALSPIQNTGPAIHVNFRPLNAPYTVLAIGDPDTLQARFLDSTHGSVWFSLARSLGFGFEMENDDDLELPAARVRTLRAAVTKTLDEDRMDKEINP